jgi:mRNA-degrading endonuclease RelE of RelBE toxin-antitoxin system
MVRRLPYRLIYDTEIPRQLRSIERKYHALIRENIEEQLTYEPGVETNNRKPLERAVTFDAWWELRFGPNNRFRVYYRIREPEGEVHILAIGVKERGKVSIGGEEYDL